MKYYDTDMIKSCGMRGGFTVTFQERGYSKKEFERLYKERIKQKINDKYGVKNEILHNEKH